MSSKTFSELLNEAQEIVRSKITWRKFIKSTPLDSDIAVWMVEFARANTTAPPELAELQASFKSVGDAYDAEREENSKLRAEIERLKGGQGEPCENCEGTGGVRVSGGSDSCPVCHGSGEIASQPAPESSELVQLLERAKVYARGPFLDEINACLDKVKELNQ